MSGPLDDLLSAVGIANNQLKETSTVIKNITDEQVRQQNEAIKAQQQAGEYGKIVTKAEETAKVLAQDKILAQATKLGTNLDDSAEILSTLSTQWRDAATQSVKAYERVEKNVNARFLDDPLEWVKSQLDLEDSVKAAQAVDAKRGTIEHNLNFAQQQTQQVAVTQMALAKTRSAETVQATLDGADAILRANIARQKVNDAGVNIQGIKTLNDMNLQELNLSQSVFSAKNQEASMQMQRAQFAQSQKQFQLMMEERQERISQKKADREEMEDFANVVRKGAAALGYEDVSAFPTPKIVQLVNMKAPHFSDFLQAGMKTTVSNSPVVSDDPGQAARIIVQTGAPLRPEQRDIKQFLQNAWGNAASPDAAMKGGYDPSKPEALTKAAGTIAFKQANEYMSNIKPMDSANIYAAPPLPVVADIPAIKNSAFYKKTLAPQLAAGGLKEFNSDQLVAMAVTGIKNKTLTYNEASEGLQGMFNGAVQLNNVTKNYKAFGLPNQKGYNAQVELGRGTIRKYDLTQQQSINAILNSRLSKFNEVSRSVLDARPFGFN